jgi:hypothetical protein
MAIDTETMQLIERIVARSIANATSLKGAADEISKGVTQYVGARYVPLFAEPLEWDKTKAYEPLTIVLHQGNSYTSRQYVPVGVEIGNDSFWALTGNYNAQVEQYRKEAKAVSDKCDTIAKEAKAVSDKCDTIAKKANDALSLAQTYEQDIASNDAELAGTAESGLKKLITDETERAKGAEGTISQNLGTISGNVNTLTQTVNTLTTLTQTVNTLTQTVNEQSEAISNNTTANHNHDLQLAGTLDSGLKELINSKFPIAADSIEDGVITATKLDTSAINSILHGFTVRRFDSTDSNADNTGMICPEGGTLQGFYIVELGILVLNNFVGTEKQTGGNVFSLPSYVPSVSKEIQLSNFGLLGWNTSSNFANWTGLKYGRGRHLIPNSAMGQMFALVGSPVAYLKPYETSSQNASYANATANNQII